MDRTAPGIVIVGVILCLVAGAGYVALMMPFFLPDVIGSRLIDVNGWILGHLPRRAFNALVAGLPYVTVWTAYIACSVSLIAGLRAWRTGPLTRRCIATCALGLVLATVVAAGPLWFHTSVRSWLDSTRVESRRTMESMRQRLESDEISADLRQKVWLLYARSMYMDDGVLVSIPDEHGSTSPYQPTASEVAARDSYHGLFDRFRPPVRDTVVALFFVALSLGLGLFTPIPREPPLSRMPD